MLMAKPSDRSGFKELLAEWNRILKASGFIDAEDPAFLSGNVWRYKAMHCDIREARTEYFRILRDKIRETDFEDELEKKILTLHSEGHRVPEIQRILEISGHRCKIYKPIYRWLIKWGLK